MDREIIILLEQKLDIMKELLNITQSISEIIKKDDTEELLKVFKSRQQLMEAIDLLDSKLLKFFKDDKDALIKYLTSDIKIRAVYDNVLSLIKEIKEIDDANLESIKNAFSKIKEDISTLRQAETALKGYGVLGTTIRNGAFIDTKK